MSPTPAATDRSYSLPTLGGDPSTNRQGTTPGSFAKQATIAPGVAGRYTYASPDTPGMPEASEKTAWDFLPEGWHSELVAGIPFNPESLGAKPTARESFDDSGKLITFFQADETARAVSFPIGFTPVTQLEHARLGIVTPEMKRVAEREPHLTAVQVRDEVRRGADGHPRQQGASRLRSRPDGDRAGQQDQGQRQHGGVARQQRDRRGSRETEMGRAVGGRTP